MSLEKIPDQLNLISMDVISNMISSTPHSLSSKFKGEQSTIKTQHRFRNWWGMKGSVPGQPEANTGKARTQSPGRSFILQWSTLTIICMMSIKPCPDPAHMLCIRTLRLSFRFRATTASEHLNRFQASQSLWSTSLPSNHRFRASQSLPSNITSKHPCFQATASTATLLPGKKLQHFRVLPQLSSIASKGNNISSNQWFKAWFIWYPIYHRIKWESNEWCRICIQEHSLPRTHVYLDITVIMKTMANALGFPKKKEEF